MSYFTVGLLLSILTVTKSKRSDIVHQVLQTSKRRRRAPPPPPPPPPSGAGASNICDFVGLGHMQTPQRGTNMCVHVEGGIGEGKVVVWYCEGYRAQEWALCKDGTLRNLQSTWCIDVSTSPAKTIPCTVYPQVPSSQKFSVTGQKKLTFMGVQQSTFQLQSAHGGCLTTIGDNVGTGTCDHWFLFKNRGAVIAHGKLLNQKASMCMDAPGISGVGNLLLNTCDNGPDQVFTLYESGELVNKASDQCVHEETSGNVHVTHCKNQKDTQWLQVSQHGSSFLLSSRKSSQCIDASGRDGAAGENLGIWTCTDEVDQRWEWLAENWHTPQGRWSLVGSNENGAVKQTVTSSTEWSSSVTDEMSASFGSEIEAGFDFGGVTVTSEVASSTARTWTDSGGETVSVEMTCQYNDDGSIFTGGAMWQFQMTGESTVWGSVSWHAPMIRCTKNLFEPKCPPFEKCADQNCTMCKGMLS